MISRAVQDQVVAGLKTNPRCSTSKPVIRGESRDNQNSAVAILIGRIS
jgi:hypothetical protein